MDNNKTCLYVTGFSKDTSRHTLLTEFGKFGRTNKLYLDPNGRFAKVFFATQQSAEVAVNAFKNSILNWKVSHFIQDSNPNMANYGNNYEDEEFCENYEYCNIHGQPLVVLQADSGDLYVNLKDIKRTGFALFRRDTFDAVLVDNRQIDKEFELHLLSEAKNYILRHKVTSIDENRILETIERCRSKLLGDNSHNSFNSGRSISQSTNSITITSNVDSGSRPVPQRGYNKQPPKPYQKGRRDNVRFNSANSNMESEHNSSSSSETNGNMRRPRGGVDGYKTPRTPREPREEIPKISFEPEQIYEVLVSHKEKDNVFWVQDQKYTEQLEEVILKVNESAVNLKAVNAVQGQLGIAEFEGVWNRCRVINIEPLMVHFLDYGNKSGVETVKPLSDSLKTIPALANRVVINVKQNVTEDMLIKISIKQKYDDGTYLAHVVEEHRKPEKKTFVTEKPEKKIVTEKPVEPEPPKQKVYFSVPKPLSEIQNGDKVMVLDVEGNKFLVKTKECVANTKTIVEYVKNLDKTALIIPNVKVGQLVLCSKDSFPGLFRAVVIKRDNDLVATVKYIDYPGEADLSVKSLRNIDDFLAEQPASVLATPEFKPLENLNKEAEAYIGEICLNREKFTVIMSEGRFDLQEQDGAFLSHTLRDIMAPKPVLQKATQNKQPDTKKEEKIAKTESVPETKPKTAVNQAKVLYDEMDWIEMEPGTYTLMCYCIQSLDDLTFLSSSEEAINHLETVMGIEVNDMEPYGPGETEMCLVSYKSPQDDEASWYRAVVLSVDGDVYTVSFVDFGDMQPVMKKDIRRFPENLKMVPILGIGCECTDFPKKPEVLERLKELIPEGTEVEVVLKELNGLKYQIEMPQLYKKLKAEKIF